MWLWILLSLANLLNGGATSCNRVKDPGETSFACVCTARYCDDFKGNPTRFIKHNSYLVYKSSSDGGRLEQHIGKFSRKNDYKFQNSVVIAFNTSEIYQEILGFGGAMTDSTGLNIASLNKAAQKTLMNQYFGRNGIGYSFIRVPFGGTDFSTRDYSYDDTVNDTMLQHFALQEEDYQYKIPYLKMAEKLSPIPIKLISSSWSGPKWMKESRNGTNGFNRLKKEYYQLYADYYIRCLNAYKKNGLKFWGVSPQNEPSDGVDVAYAFNNMGFTAEEMRNFIGSAFGPTLRSRGYDKLKLIILDDNRKFLPQWAEVVMKDPEIKKYVSGIGIHWYFDFLNPNATKLDATHYEFPDKFLLYTEASVIPSFDVSVPNPKAVRLGNWERAENYTSNIIQDINHWVTGWVDWNLALNTEGGPNWVNNYVDSAIIVNAEANEFYKQPLFYAIAHFSKFVPPGSRRIGFKISDNSFIECVTFIRPDDIVAIVLQNRKDTDVDVIIPVDDGKEIMIPINAHSIHTVLYKPKVRSRRTPKY